jgi:hypothetical protein
VFLNDSLQVGKMFVLEVFRYALLFLACGECPVSGPQMVEVFEGLVQKILC